MEELLVKIYQSVISSESDSINLGKKYDNKIQMLIAPYREILSADDVDKLQELLYEVAYVAEQGGFMLGARFMAKLISEITAKEIQIIDN